MKTVYRLWLFAIGSPIIYLVICLLIDRAVFAKREVAGFWPVDDETYRFLFGLFAAIGVASMPAVFALKTWWAEQVAGEESGDEVGTFLDHPRGWRFIALFMVCDTVALLGLILFLIQGQLNAMLFFGVLGMVCYGLCCPGAPPGNDERERD